jgi:hypothetical protein
MPTSPPFSTSFWHIIMYFAFKLFFFFIKMYSVSVKCFIFTLIINFDLFFGRSTGGKELLLDQNSLADEMRQEETSESL